MNKVIVTVEDEDQADQIVQALSRAELDGELDFAFNVEIIEQEVLKLRGGPNWEMRPTGTPRVDEEST